MKKSSRFIHRFGVALAAFALCGLTATIASATPSTQIWIPSTDIQAYKTVHLNFDTYIRGAKSNDGISAPRTAPLVVIGPTVGVLPFEKIQAELGFDLISGGGDRGGLDKYPLYGHFKIGMPEDNTWIPAVAVGMYDIGTKSGDAKNGATRNPARTGHLLRPRRQDAPRRGPLLRRATTAGTKRPRWPACTTSTARSPTKTGCSSVGPDHDRDLRQAVGRRRLPGREDRLWRL